MEFPELSRRARTIDRWSDEVLAYHTTGRAWNGRVENIHLLAEKIRRNAHGFANHIHYRRRLIGRLGIKWAPSQLAESEAVNHAQSRRAAQDRSCRRPATSTIRWRPSCVPSSSVAALLRTSGHVSCDEWYGMIPYGALPIADHDKTSRSGPGRSPEIPGSVVELPRAFHV